VIAGALEVMLSADVARLRRDMGGALDIVTTSGLGMERAAGLATKALGLLGLGLSAASFIGMVKGALDAGEALHDLSLQTGASVESLSAMVEIGRTTNTTAEDIGAMMNKLAKNMATAKDDTSGAGAALKALGLDYRTFRDLQPDVQMRTLAQAMAQFDDGAGKSAVAMELLGKSGAKALPYFKDLAAAQELVATTTADQAAMADLLNDSMTTSAARVNALQREMAFALLPAMVGVHDLTGELSAQVGGYLAGSADHASERFDALRGVILVVGRVLETAVLLASDVAFVLKMTGNEIGGIAAQVAAVAQGDFAGAAAIGRAMREDAAKARAELDRFQASIAGSTDRILQAREATRLHGLAAGENADEMRRLTGMHGTASRGLVKFNADLEDNAKNTKKAADESKKLIERLQDMADASAAKAQEQLAELAGVRKLSQAEEAYVKVMREVAKGNTTVAALQKAGIVTTLRQAMATDDLVEAYKDEARWLEETEKANRAALDAGFKSIDQLEQQVAKEREALATYGMTARELAAREAAQLRGVAAQREDLAATMELVDWSGQRSAQLREEARLLRERADLAEQGVVVKEAKAAADEWAKVSDQIGQGLTDSLFRAFESGRDAWSTLWEGIKNTLKTTVLRMAIQPVQQGFSQFVGGAIGDAGTIAGTWARGGSMSLESLSNLNTVRNISSLYQSASGALGYGATYSGATYGTAFGSQQSAMLAAQEAGMGSASAGASAGWSSAGWAAAYAAMVYKGVQDATRHQEQGFNADAARNAGDGLFGARYGVGTVFAETSNLLQKLGLNQQWADILSMSTGFAKHFGRAAPKVEGRNIVGTLGEEGFTGTFDQRIVEKGGILRSDKTYTVSEALDAEIEQTLDDMAKALRGGVADYATGLGLPVEALAKVSKAINVDVTFADADQRAERISAAMREYSDALFASLDPSVQPFLRAGESVEQGLMRLNTLKVFSDDLNGLGGVFSNIASLGIQAKEELIGMAGGMDALIGTARNFVSSYYSQEEQAALQARSLLSSFEQLGIDPAMLRDRAGLRAIVEEQSKNLATTEDRQRLADLLAIAQAYAPVAQYLEQQAATDGAVAMSLAELAGQAPASAVLAGILNDQSAAQAQAQVDGLAAVNASVVASGAEVVMAVEGLVELVQTGQQATIGVQERIYQLFDDAIQPDGSLRIVDVTPP
jgi:hypothetical protein